MSARSYLDWNATTPMREEAKAAFAAAASLTGNPSSVHAEGRATRALIEAAREQVAALIGAQPGNVFFTASGTEANMLALTPAIETASEKRPRSRLFVSAIEHASVRAGGRFAREDIEELPVRPDGCLDLVALAAAIANTPRPLISLMLANNETGIIQPVAEAATVVHAAGGLIHVDAVQAVGRIACDMTALGADLLTLSAHKIGGAKGAGALVRAREDIHFPEPLIRGGGQERGLRAGTENVASIAAFGAAAAAARARRDDEAAHMVTLRNQLEAGLLAATPEAIVFGREAVLRLPNTTLFALAGIKAETAVIAFDLDGVAVSSGAACSSGKVQPSHVLAAMGVTGPLQRGAVRVSVGWNSTVVDVARLLDAWTKLATALSKKRTGIAA
jgi:cysteine desulfurase